MTHNKTNRREFLAGLAGCGSVALLPSHALLPNQTLDLADSATESGQPLGNSYKLLGYKRLIIDYHYSEFNPRTLEKANAPEIIEAVANLGVESLLLYSKDHWGNVYHKSGFSKRHRNVPQDLFGEVLKGVKEHGVKVVAYTTVCWDEDSARKHPDWLVLNAENHPMRLDDGKVYAKWSFLCLNSPYRDYFVRQMDELIGNYDFEGLFLDIVMQHRALVCYNPYCLSKWKERYGTDLPRQLSDTDYARYLDFNRDTVDSLFKEVKEIGSSHGKRFMMTHNFGLTYKYDDYLASEFDTHGADFYLPSIRAKMFRARGHGKEVELIGHRFNRLWDFTVKPLPLMQFEVATAVAHNCAMCYVDQPYLDGSLDPQVYRALKSAFVAADELVPKIKGTVPHAEIGLLSSERSFEFDYSTYHDFGGAYAILSQLHWPFDVVTEDDLTDEKLKRCPVLVVPNIVHLSAEHVQAVRSYVEHGGKLFYCYRSATRDENGRELDQPSFGFVRLTGESEDQVSFIRPKWEASSRYLRVSALSMFEALEPSDMQATITNPALRVTETEWITHNAMPGEDTQLPALVQGKYGAGSFIYCGFRLFNEYVEQAQPSLKQVFETSLLRLHQPAIWVDAPGNIEVVFNKAGKNKLQIALVNGVTSKVMTGDMWGGERAPRGHVTIPEVVPVHGITVRTSMPVRKAFDLRGNELPIGGKSNTASITLPVLKQYDLIEMIVGE
jgi:hypothetical protein